MPIFDYECPQCRLQKEIFIKPGEPHLVRCPTCPTWMKKVITKMPLRTYTKRPQDRLWGTSHISSSEKFKEKQKRKGEKK